MKSYPNPNDWEIVVEPEGAGDFQYVHMSEFKYSNEDAKSLQNKIQDDIKRHVDKVKNTYVKYNSWNCGKCNDYYETREEAENCCKD